MDSNDSPVDCNLSPESHIVHKVVFQDLYPTVQNFPLDNLQWI